VLRESRTPPSGRNYFLPQGVDTDHFSRREGEPPEPLRSLPKPWIGFFGIIAPWIDQELLVRVARRHPKASVVLLGRSSTSTARLEAEANIHVLGEVPYAQLPQWSQWFDVGLIPFVVNELTVAANPLKLLEYLSLGIPVVSTDLPEVRKFRPLARVAETPEDFVRAVSEALDDRSSDAAKLRRMKALGFSWRAIAGDVKGKILAADAEDRSARGGS
jgi:glycosyltransferase involved in cell wall biosynthesis